MLLHKWWFQMMKRTQAIILRTCSMCKTWFEISCFKNNILFKFNETWNKINIMSSVNSKVEDNFSNITVVVIKTNKLWVQMLSLMFIFQITKDFGLSQSFKRFCCWRSPIICFRNRYENKLTQINKITRNKYYSKLRNSLISLFSQLSFPFS